VSDIDQGRNRLTLGFRDPSLERDFQTELAASNAPQLRTGLFTGIALWLATALIFPATLSVQTTLVVATCTVMAVLNLIALIATRGPVTLTRQQAVGLALNTMSAIAVLVLSQVLGVGQALAAPAILLIAMFAFVALRLRFVFGLVAAATYLVGYAVVVSANPDPTDILQLFLVAAAIVVGLGATYQLEAGARDVYVQRRIIEAQTAALADAQATSERLLLNILPAKVAERLAAGETAIADWFDDATVLFADLVGFTRLAAELEPRATRDLLDRLFTGFDELADRHDLEKIKTIGDAYMAVGGLSEPVADHPARVVAFGLDLLDLTARVGQEIGRPLDLRVGIHTGPVVAGVVGTRKFSYDLWGDTVNVASRLESLGVPGSLQLSETTWQRVRSRYTATPRGPVELKRGGQVSTFLIGRRDAATPPDTAIPPDEDLVAFG
jgi:class 3 adenylate cyclase